MKQVRHKKQRKRWSREETIGFLRCYLARKPEFEHQKKKRLAYANVLEDMVSLTFTDSERTPLCLESKMRSLLQAYKAARDNNRSTGASPCFDPCMELMEELHGTSPIISNDHTLHVGYRSFETARSPTPSSSDSAQIASTSALSPSSSALVMRRKRSAREVYYDKKLEFKKLKAEERKKARSKAIEDLKDMLRKKWQKELEGKKVALLEKIANCNYLLDSPPSDVVASCAF